MHFLSIHLRDNDILKTGFKAQFFKLYCYYTCVNYENVNL